MAFVGYTNPLGAVDHVPKVGRVESGAEYVPSRCTESVHGALGEVIVGVREAIGRCDEAEGSEATAE